MINKKVNSKRTSRKKNTLSKKTRRVSRRVSRKDRGSKKNNKKTSKLKGAGAGMSQPTSDARYHIGTSPNCFAFYDLNRMRKVTQELLKHKGVEKARVGSWDYFYYVHNKLGHVELLDTILREMSADDMLRNVKTYFHHTNLAINQVANMLQELLVLILNDINIKRQTHHLSSLTEKSNDVLTSVPYKYNQLEDDFINAILRPSDTRC